MKGRVHGVEREIDQADRRFRAALGGRGRGGPHLLGFPGAQPRQRAPVAPPAVLEGVQRHRDRRIQEHGRVHGADHRARRDLLQDRHRRGRGRPALRAGVDRDPARRVRPLCPLRRHLRRDPGVRHAGDEPARAGDLGGGCRAHPHPPPPQREHGALGVRASRFTEGGYCTLFREGMRLKGRAASTT